MESKDLELKKLVYLYIINYARLKPEEAIMIVNVFIRDIKSGSPMIKALAVRTIGYIKVDKLNDYLIEPLKQSIFDEDPYVRKCAILTIPKIYEISPDLVNDNGIILILQKMLATEGNSYVLSNLILSLSELSYFK